MSDDPLKIPVQAEGVDQAASALGRVTAALRSIGQQSAQTALSLANDGAAAWATFERWGAKIGEVVEKVAALSAEQQALDETSARLGLDFNAAAASAGRFVDETEAMGAAARLAGAGIHLTQEEMNQLTARAAILSQNLRITSAEGFERITTAITSGSTRALREFGPEMEALGGQTHTARERLNEFVHTTEGLPRATDDAVTSIARFRDNIEDAERTAAHAAATSFMQLIDAQQRIGIGARDAGDGTSDFTMKLRAAGEAAGETALVVLRAAQMIAGGVATAFAAPAALMQSFFHAMQLARSGDFAGATDALTSFGDHGFLADAIAFTNEGREGLTSLLSGETFDASRPTDSTSPARPEAAAGGGNVRGGAGGGRQQRPQTLQQLMNEAGAARRLHFEGTTPTSLWVPGEQEEHDAEERRQQEAEKRRREAETQARAEADARAHSPAARLHDMEVQAHQAREQRDLQQRLEMQRTFTDRWTELHERQTSAAQHAAEGISGAFTSLGKALSDHFQAVVAGRESVGQALQGVLGDTLTSIGKEAAVKGGMETAEGLAALAGVVTAGLAPGHFAAAGAYFGVAGLAGLAGAALTPSSGGASGGGSGSPARERAAVLPTSTTQQAPAPVVNNYYAPIIGGREAPKYEVGDRMNRYTRAADARLQRAP